MDVLQFTLGRFNRLAKKRDGFESVIQSLAAFFQAILYQHLGVNSARAVIQLGSVNRDGILDLLEEVLVIHDVAEVLILAVQPVGAADSLEQTVILHRLIDVKVSAGLAHRIR